ncbi:MAG: hypothetical protein Q9227_001250 [Pyrenula ochraceoflavens]
MASVASDREADRAAVVLDFRDFTEDLPADLLRSLNLIRTLNERCTRYMNRYNELVKIYQSALDIPGRERPNTGNILREMIRLQELHCSCRQTSAAEASRFYDTIEMNYHRMMKIHEQLEALPQPPSRDPTPEILPSPVDLQRSRGGRGAQMLTINPPNPSRYAPNGQPKKTLKINMATRPGVEAEESDEESNLIASARKKTPGSQKGTNKPSRSSREPTRGPRVSASVPEPPRPPEDAPVGSEHKPWTRLTEWEMWKLRKKMKKNSGWEPSLIMVKRTLAETGRGDDNYQVAKAEAEAKGIDLLDCDRERRSPPPVAEPTPQKPPAPQPTVEVGALQNRGMKLNEAKKIKRDQLAEERARERAQNAARQTEQAAQRLSDMGKALKNVFDLTRYFPDRAASSPVQNGTVQSPVKKEASTKKRKAESPVVAQSPSVEASKNGNKKRKMGASPVPVPSLTATASAPPSTAAPRSSSSAKPTPLGDSLKIPLLIPTQSSGSTATSSPGSPKRSSSTTKPTSATLNIVPTPPPVISRPESRRSTRLSSVSLTETPTVLQAPKPKTTPTPILTSTPAVPPTTRVLRGAATPTIAKQSPKEKNNKEKVDKEKTPAQKPTNAELTPKTIATAASERSKRRAPGAITQSNEEGGTKASVAGGGRRAAAIKAGNKQATTAAQNKSNKSGGYVRVDIDGKEEWIDPDEVDIYCTCQDVSYGEMICCELDDKCPLGGGWFHLGCVGLAEIPPRTVKWYCPECRKMEDQGVFEELPSRRIYIMGVGSIGTFVGHSMVNIDHPPNITLMLHKQEMYDEFKRVTQSLRVITHKVHESRTGFDVEVLNTSGGWMKRSHDRPPTPPRTYPVEPADDDKIHNLIVTVKGPATVKALKSVSHRLLPTSTILFMQNGMGQIPLVNKEVFPDPETRPAFMLGIVSHGLYKHENFVVNHAGFGTTSLGIWRDTQKYPLASKPTSIAAAIAEPQPTETHLWPITARFLLRTLLRTPVLVATHFPELDIFQMQLEKLVMNAVVNPLTAILDVKNGSLLHNVYFTRVFRLLIAEMSLVIRSLPELRGIPNVDKRFSAPRLENLVVKVIENTAQNSSSMREDARHLKQTEIDFINGYIVSRGEELGIKCVMNFLIQQLVHGKTYREGLVGEAPSPIQVTA